MFNFSLFEVIQTAISLMHNVRRPNTARQFSVVVCIQLSVISVYMSTDTVSSSNYQNVHSVQKGQDWPKYTALRDTVVDFGVHRVLVSDSDSLCTTGDETLDPVLETSHTLMYCFVLYLLDIGLRQIDGTKHNLQERISQLHKKLILLLK